jgi:2-oxo-4-hydroxy-4-carboxy-5-ureidoimidazoline decarboxylase
VLEHADPEAPYGLKGVGEPPNISTPPAIAAALRAATGRELARIPVRPEHIVGLGGPAAATEEAFVARYGAVFERSPWVAREAWRRAPFASIDELHEAMVAAVRAAPRAEQLALVRAHPELAGREAAAGELTEASTREQASAGLDRLTAPELDRWRQLNREYRERFGFPLVVCVREHTKDSILAWAQERLANDADEEVEIALEEIAKIARLRLEELGL